MSKQLYEEAIADLKKVKEIAEDNAKRAVVEAVAPRIRELIEKELLGEAETSDKEDKDILIDVGTDQDAEEHDPVDMPQGSEIVIPLDPTLTSQNAQGGLEIVDNLEIEESIKKIISVIKPSNIAEMKTKLRYVEKMVDTLAVDKSFVNESKSFKFDILHLKNVIGVIYEYVQNDIKNPKNRLGYNLKIRKCLEKLENLQETKMKRNLLGEEKVTIELDLPGIELGDALENAAVDLVLDEEGDEGSEDLESEEAPEEEEPSEEEPSEEEPSEEEPSEEEGLLEMDDDSVVEIDESMLRREIAFMKLLRESDESVQDVDGSAPGADEFDDFGGASEEGEALELELSESYMDETVIDETDPVGPANAGTAAAAAYTDKKPGSVDEEDELLELDMGDDGDGYDLEEMDVMNQAADMLDGQHSLGSQPNRQSRQPSPSNESVRSQMAKELKLQESLRKRASELKKLYESYKVATSRAKTLLERKDATTNSSKLKAAYAVTARRYNGSVTHFNKLSESLSKGTAKNSTRSNNVAKPDASTGSDTLSKKLAETNLLNAKLLFTNKLLQTESLTARQKAQVIEQLDAAETVREAKLVYESLAKALVKPRRTVSEGRILGSSSQTTRAASTQTKTLNEGVEAERWARLAGIK